MVCDIFYTCEISPKYSFFSFQSFWLCLNHPVKFFSVFSWFSPSPFLSTSPSPPPSPQMLQASLELEGLSEFLFWIPKQPGLRVLTRSPSAYTTLTTCFLIFLDIPQSQLDSPGSLQQLRTPPQRKPSLVLENLLCWVAVLPDSLWFALLSRMKLIFLTRQHSC